MKKYTIIILTLLLLLHNLSVFAMTQYVSENSVINELVQTNKYQLISSTKEEKGISHSLVDVQNEHVSIYEENDIKGNKKLIIQEGNLTNQVLIKNDGKIYLDGRLVEINSINDPNEILPYAQRRYSTRNCPYGKSGDYSVLRKNHGKKSIAFQQDIASITKTAFVTILLSQFNIIIGVAGGILYTAYDRMLSRNPKARAMGAVHKEYYHKKGKIVGPGMVIQHYVKLYFDEGCNSYICDDTIYEVFSW